MGVGKLLGAALRPGATLKHESHKIMPVDGLHALALVPERGSTLIHARLGQDNLEQLRVVVGQIAMEVFAQRGWTIPARRYSATQRMVWFVEQVWREYMGEPCHRCRGHGYVGRKLELIRHRLGGCQSCQGRGFVFVPSSAFSVETRAPLQIRQLCRSCHGKGLTHISEEVRAQRLRVCPSCFGSGSVVSSVRVRAKAMKLGKSQVHDVWQERFRVVLMTLRDYERDAMVVCREQLYGN